MVTMGVVLAELEIAALITIMATAVEVLTETVKLVDRKPEVPTMEEVSTEMVKVQYLQLAMGMVAVQLAIAKGLLQAIPTSAAVLRPMRRITLSQAALLPSRHAQLYQQQAAVVFLEMSMLNLLSLDPAIRSALSPVELGASLRETRKRFWSISIHKFVPAIPKNDPAFTSRHCQTISSTMLTARHEFDA